MITRGVKQIIDNISFLVNFLSSIESDILNAKKIRKVFQPRTMRAILLFDSAVANLLVNSGSWEMKELILERK
jgi:hypothetical protein